MRIKFKTFHLLILTTKQVLIGCVSSGRLARVLPMGCAWFLSSKFFSGSAPSVSGAVP